MQREENGQTTLDLTGVLFLCIIAKNFGGMLQVGDAGDRGRASNVFTSLLLFLITKRELSLSAESPPPLTARDESQRTAGRGKERKRPQVRARGTLAKETKECQIHTGSKEQQKLPNIRAITTKELRRSKRAENSAFKAKCP